MATYGTYMSKCVNYSGRGSVYVLECTKCNKDIHFCRCPSPETRETRKPCRVCGGSGLIAMKK